MVSARPWRRPVIVFSVAAGLPFLASLTWFVVSARASLLTDPSVYIETLKRTGSTTTMISLQVWKHFLAQDAICRNAEAVVIGSSRVREIDRTVTGISTCNLYVDGLAASGFERLARVLPPVPPRAHHLVYVGVDHFWLWPRETDAFDGMELSLADRSTTLWRIWTVLRTLGFFQWRDVVEMIRRGREGAVPWEEQHSVWYADGHLYHPMYYGQKLAGRHPSFSRSEIEDAAVAIYDGHRVQEAELGHLAAGVRVLYGRGYTVRTFWNPMSPAHVALARQHYPGVFQPAIDAVDRVAATLPLDRYVPADETLDPTRFGCTDRDYFDTTHVDVDCMRRVFAGVFGRSPAHPCDDC